VGLRVVNVYGVAIRGVGGLGGGGVLYAELGEVVGHVVVMDFEDMYKVGWSYICLRISCIRNLLG
jgi:hypothetical protein